MERLPLGIKVLEQSGVAHYLLSLGVVKPRDVIDDGFAIADASRRNRVFLATRSSGPTLVVKQGDAPALAHEARILRLLAPHLAGHVPAVVHHEGGTLVLSTVPGARDWGEHEGRFPRIPARTLGRLLARLHDLRVEAPPSLGSSLALHLAEPPHSLLLELSATAQDLVARIQASEFLCARLEELRAAEAGDALVHGDLRWENCLAVPPPGARRRTRVLLVDWEFSGRADPAVDAGTVLADYLRVWVGSVPIVEAVDPGRLVDRARHPLTAMRPAMAEFWTAYRTARSRPPPLTRVVEQAAVRLVQTAIEAAQGLAATTAHVVTLLQLADNLLRRPDVAAEHLLGLGE